MFMKLPTLERRRRRGPVRCPAVVRAARLRGRARARDGRRRRRSPGYAVADDVSARDLQRREPQWTRAKGADTFCPWGPWITTADEVPDPEDAAADDARQRRAAPGLRARPTSIFGPQRARRLHRRDDARSSPATSSSPARRAASAWRWTRRGSSQPGDVVRIEIESLGAIEHRDRLSIARSSSAPARRGDRRDDAGHRALRASSARSRTPSTSPRASRPGTPCAPA